MCSSFTQTPLVLQYITLAGPLLQSHYGMFIRYVDFCFKDLSFAFCKKQK